MRYCILRGLAGWYNSGFPRKEITTMPITMKSVFSLTLVVLLALSLSQAQEAKELARHPGDVLKFEVKFDGPDAAKVTSLEIYLSCSSAQPGANQAGFVNNFGGTKTFQAVSPRTFQPEIVIPKDILPGDYSLSIHAHADVGNAIYDSGKQFQLHIRVDNSRTFTAPGIIVKEQ